MVLAMSCISVLGSLVWGHHIYTLGLEADTRAYFTAVTMMISLPTAPELQLKGLWNFGCFHRLSLYALRVVTGLDSRPTAASIILKLLVLRILCAVAIRNTIQGQYARV